MWMRGYTMKTSTLTLNFEGDHNIDLSILANTLSATVEKLSLIADYQLDENDWCKFKVVNIQEGSFEIIIQQILEVAPVLFNTCIPVLDAFRQMLEIRKFLKGNLPKKQDIIRQGEKVKLQANGNTLIADSIVFNNYITDNKIEKSMAKASRAFTNDEDHFNLQYDFDIDNHRKDISFSKEEMIKLATPMDVESLNDNIETNEMETDLKVRKPDLIGDSQWHFILNGKTIKAEVIDKEFINDVRSNAISFNSDSTLRVKLEVKYTDTEVLEYRVLKVINYR